MKRGELNGGKNRGCVTFLLAVWALFMVKVVSVLDFSFGDLWDRLAAGEVGGIAYLWLAVFPFLLSGFVLWRILPKGLFRKKARTGEPENRSPFPLSYPHTRAVLL